MGAISNVIRRGRMFHFRRVVPTDLRERLKRRELVRSLGACDPRTARLFADQLFWLAEQLFETARTAPMLTDVQLARLVQGFYNHVLEREASVRASGAFFSEEARLARIGYWEKVGETARRTLGSNTLDSGAWTSEAVARMQGLDWSSLSEAERHQCKQAVHRASIDLAGALKARYEGDFTFEPRDKLLWQILQEKRPSEPAALTPVKAETQPQRSTLSAIHPDFIKIQLARSEWRQQTAHQADATYRLFVAICGDKSLSSYTRADASHFRKVAERMPSDYGKAARFRGLTPGKIIAIHERLPEAKRSPLLTQKTIKRHFSALSALWNDAVASGEASANIFAGFKFSNVKRASEERDMWKDEELAILFTSPVWTGCLSARQRAAKGNEVIRDEKFWVPLITLFSGMRLEEICQLQTDDIRVEDGITFFDINDRPPRQLKNKNAARRVPVHSALIRIGLMQHVASFGGRRSFALFPMLRPGGADGKLGHSFSKWFTRYRRDIGVYRKNLDFHSLRHTATTLMHQADVSPMVLDHLTGHSTPGETARYTKGSSLKQLAAAIETIKPSLDFASLYRTS